MLQLSGLEIFWDVSTDNVTDRKVGLDIGRWQFDTVQFYHPFPPLDCPSQDAMHALHRARLAPAACRTAGNGLRDWPNWHSGSLQ